MIRVNVHEAKAHLSRYLKEVEAGGTVIVCRRNVAIAELRPVTRISEGQRPLGLAAGTFEIPEAIFEPRPSEILDAFAGRGS